jgi:hypothetical protein
VRTLCGYLDRIRANSAAYRRTRKPGPSDPAFTAIFGEVDPVRRQNLRHK